MSAIHPIDPLRWPSLADLGERGGRLRASLELRLAELLFRQAVGRVPVRVLLPDGTTLGAGAPEAPSMVLHRPEAFYRRVGAGGLIGFGESYMAGDWDSPDLGAFLTELSRRITTLIPGPLQRLRALFVARQPSTEENTEANTRQNISRHYDLSNDLFALFLDETMTYSSALFDSRALPDVGRTDLAEAQRRKIDRLLDQARVGPGSRVLEIGTGWGELCIRAAERGATVRSVTLSSEQQELARVRVAEAGYADRVQIDLIDYRAIEGEYDAVVSVEMIEAVGMDYWPAYFAKIDAVLAPGGTAAIQAITMPHDRMLATRYTYTWVHKYIFPGGFLPSIRAIEEVTDATSLRIVDNHSMGLHYAQTLRLWDEAFLAAHDRVAGLGFDTVFERMWHFYLEYSRAGFASRYLDVNQLTFTREA